MPQVNHRRPGSILTKLLIPVALMTTSAVAQTYPPAPSATPAQSGDSDMGALRERARLATLGLLTFVRMNVEMQDVPMQDALDELSRALGVPVVGRYEDAEIGLGIDGERPISMRLRNARAIDVLEMMIAEAADVASCTWQLRGGTIEVGTKWHLGFTPESRPYRIGDLMIEPPMFVSMADVRALPYDLCAFEEHPYRSSSLKNGPTFDDEHKCDDPQPRIIRTTPERLFDELQRALAEMIEPGNWDFKLMYAPPTGTENGKDKGYHSGSNRIAAIRRIDGDTMAVEAPDFFHRQIFGSGIPIHPGDAPLHRPEADTPHIVLTGIARDDGKDDHAFIPALEQIVVDDDPIPLIDGSLFSKDFRPRVHAMLTRHRMDVIVEDEPARQVFESIRSKLPVPLIVRYSDDAVGYGIDPKTRISCNLRNATALDVLEELMAECSIDNGDCNWQVRPGYLEFGTTSRLNLPAARTLRFYDIQDMLLGTDGNGSRQLAWTLGIEIVDTVVSTIEPAAWDFGQLEFYSEPKPKTVTPALPSGSSARKKPTPMDIRAGLPRYREPQKPAIIRQWRGMLLVSAPNYIHRQIGEPMN